MKSKRTPEKMTLTRIFFKKEGNERTFDCLTKLTVKEALKSSRMANAIFISSRKEELIVNNNPNCIESFKDGFLCGYYIDENPNEAELMKITLKDMAEMEGNEEMVSFYETLEQVKK